jgi:hypothetical protein
LSVIFGLLIFDFTDGSSRSAASRSTPKVNAACLAILEVARSAAVGLGTPGSVARLGYLLIAVCGSRSASWAPRMFAYRSKKTSTMEWP